MNQLTIIRITPEELKSSQMIRLIAGYKTVPDKFILWFEDKENVLLVNENVPEEDVKIFLQIINFEGEYLLQEAGDWDLWLDYIYDKYGYEVFSILTDKWKREYKKRCMQQAEAKASQIVNTISQYRMDDDIEHPFDEFLVYQVKRYAGRLKYKTPFNMVNLDTEYVFYLGYLMGKGIIKEETVE